MFVDKNIPLQQLDKRIEQIIEGILSRPNY
jgi:hypothetical protein